MRRLADDAFLKEEHLLLREHIRRFVRDRITPNVDRWEKEKGFPRELYRETARAGFLGIGFPEEYGGPGGDMTNGTRADFVVLVARTGGEGAAQVRETIRPLPTPAYE